MTVAVDPSALRARVFEEGYAVIPPPAVDTARSPWELVHQLVGVWPEMVERQPIRPVASGRSFASTAVFTPLHTDSQDHLGAPPGLQILVCRRAAARGGASRLVDGWAVLAQLERDDRALFDALFAVARHHRFYFGDVVGPTVSERRGHLVWTHSPQLAQDAIGRALADVLARAPVIEVALQGGETLVVDNHRMLHGRTAFDGDRELVRLLAWFRDPLFRHPRFRAAELPAAGHDEARLAVVLELLAGAPPARLAAREGITEAELYAWRTRALAAARKGLG